MPEEKSNDSQRNDSQRNDSQRSKDEVALEMMKFIAVTTGYGKGAAGAGFASGKARTPEEHAEALIELFERCRHVVG